MNHQSTAIVTIIKSLKQAGIKDNDILEEMVDHYLAEVEMHVAQGVEETEAVALVAQHIRTTDLLPLRTSKRKKWPFFVLLCAFLLIGYYVIDTAGGDESLPKETKHTAIQVESPPTGWPIAKPNVRIASHFGRRLHPITKVEKWHKGIDIPASIGTSVLATGDAIVKEVGYKKKAGHYIVLQHGDRFITKYYHLSEISVSVGGVVNKGDKIGLSGNSGVSIAPHLHYEIIEQDKAVDPMVYLGV